MYILVTLNLKYRYQHKERRIFILKIELNKPIQEVAKACGYKRTTLIMKLVEPESRFYSSDLAILSKNRYLKDSEWIDFFPDAPSNLPEGNPVLRAGSWKRFTLITGIPKSSFIEKWKMKSPSGQFREFKVSELQKMSAANLITKQEIQNYMEQSYSMKRILVVWINPSDKQK